MLFLTLTTQGFIRDNLAKVREGLAKQKKELDSSQGWFESWFTCSPWLTTLVSAIIIGLLVVFLRILTIGPCIVNRLVQFVRQRLDTIELRFSVLTLMHYCSTYPLPDEDDRELASYSHHIEEPRVQD